jgi:hypothetical protein
MIRARATAQATKWVIRNTKPLNLERNGACRSDQLTSAFAEDCGGLTLRRAQPPGGLILDIRP